MTLVKFEGDPPFALPVLQRATADAAGETVELTVYVAVAAYEPEPVPVRIRKPEGRKVRWKTARWKSLSGKCRRM
jgi:hypothetical protein